MKKALALFLLILCIIPVALANIKPDDFFNTYNCAPWNYSAETNSGYMLYADFNTSDSDVTHYKPAWSSDPTTAFSVTDNAPTIATAYGYLSLAAATAETRAVYSKMTENASNYTINYFLNCTTAPTNSVTFGYQFTSAGSGKVDGGGIVQSGTTYSFEGGDSSVVIPFGNWNMITAVADPVNNNYCFYTNKSFSLGCANDASVVGGFEIRYGRTGSACFVDNLVAFAGSGIDDCPSAAAEVTDDAPTINWTVPANNSRTNADPVLFTLNVTDDHASSLYCELRNTSTLLDSDNFSKDTYGSLSYNVPSNWESESILYNITCNDNNSNNASVYLNLTIDTNSPTLSIIAPTSGQSINKLYSNLTINIDSTDYSLYLLNYTLWNSSGIVESVQNASPVSGGTGQIMNITKIIDIGDYSVGNYKLNVSVSDPHTLSSWNPEDWDFSGSGSLYEFEADKIGFIEFEVDDVVCVEGADCEISKITLLQEDDRFKFNYAFDDAVSSFTLRITSDYITYIEDSDFKGHLVIQNRYWYDSEPFDSNVDVSVVKGKYVADVEHINVNSDNLITESIGGLNVVEQSISFSIINTSLSGSRLPYAPFGNLEIRTYQQQANESEQIGQFDKGTYNCTISTLSFDGNLYTSNRSLNNLDYCNIWYKKPDFSNSSILHFDYEYSIYDGGVWYNTTTDKLIPSDCWDYNESHVNIFYEYYIDGSSGLFRAKCYNGSAYRNLAGNFGTTGGGNAAIFEEGMNWSINMDPITTCGNYTNTSVLNVSFIDELSGGLISSSFDMSYYYYSLNGTDYVSFYYNVSGTTSEQFCIYPLYTNTTGDFLIHYSATGYNERDWIKNSYALDNYTNYENLYLLSTGNSTLILFQVYDEFSVEYQGVTIESYRYDIGTGTYSLVETKTTNSQGEAIMSLVLYNEYYRFKFYDGPDLILETSNEQITDTTLTYRISSIEDIYSRGITYSFTPTEAPISPNTVYTFTYNMSSTYWSITNCTLFLYDVNYSILNQSSYTDSTSNCYISLQFNISDYNTIISESRYVLNGTHIIYKHPEYVVLSNYSGEYSIYQWFVTDVKNFGGAGFDDFARMIMALIIILMVQAGAAYYILGVRDVEIHVGITMLLVLFFSYLGYFTVNYSAIPDIAYLPAGWLNQYIIAILVLLSGTAVYLKRNL